MEPCVIVDDIEGCPPIIVTPTTRARVVEEFGEYRLVVETDAGMSNEILLGERSRAVADRIHSEVALLAANQLAQ
ncbi:hypothetical protein [Roseiconus lacunae]|uniref:hypothetical protein n=1 Tax=Roseiconus lacunae TaxID=2605694 RepID=UPI001E46725C|nr:hypothetical protein [Roseiconus lacunae]MCD0462391.1 hypothetical protein [Roseiconus lacunae]